MVVAAWRSVVESSASDVVTESTVSTARHSTMMRANRLIGPMRTEPWGLAMGHLPFGRSRVRAIGGRTAGHAHHGRRRRIIQHEIDHCEGIVI